MTRQKYKIRRKDVQSGLHFLHLERIFVHLEPDFVLIWSFLVVRKCR